MRYHRGSKIIRSAGWKAAYDRYFDDEDEDDDSDVKEQTLPHTQLCRGTGVFTLIQSVHLRVYLLHRHAQNLLLFQKHAYKDCVYTAYGF